MGSGLPFTPIEAFGTYDPSFENAFIGVGALRPCKGNPNAPQTTIAIGATTVDNILALPHPALAAGETFVIFDTSKPGSQGVNATSPQALQQARLIYNDFGISNQFGIPLSSLEAFNLFKTPFGDVGRNTFSGLPNYRVNLALLKTTNLTESKKLEFRVEAANLFNHRNFGVPDPLTEDVANAFSVGSYMNPGFNVGSARSLRFGARFIF
jgi:hypothetical protein